MVRRDSLETRLQPVFDRAGPGLSVAFCAHQGAVDLRLSSPDGSLDEAAVEAVAAECAALLGDDVVCRGHDSLAKVCADLLRAQEKRLAVAETATGGLLAQAFTESCGACKFFAGGVVACTNDTQSQLLDVPECLLPPPGAGSAGAAVALAPGTPQTPGPP